jgi:peptide/nickel transport system substrate-binding protein
MSMTRSSDPRSLTRRGLVAAGGMAPLGVLLGAQAATASTLTGPHRSLLSGVAALAQDGASEVTIGLSNEPNTLDPHLVVGRHSETFLMNIYDSLVKSGADDEFLPGLAVSWEQIDDTTWEFALREGVTFHNGEPFTAEAVQFTFERVLDPATEAPTASLLSTLDRVDVIDPMTVRIITNQPDIMFLQRISELYGPIVPPAHVAEVGAEQFGLNPIGTGPFRLVEWVKNERIVLEAYEDYWNGPPQVDRIIVRPILEDATRISALLAGEVQLINAVPYIRVAELEANPDLRVETIPSPRVFFVVIDPREAPFDDVRVRQALNYAVDVDAIIQTLYMGHATRLATVVDTEAIGYDPSIEPFPFDPEMARQLLAEAGHPDGFETNFDAFTGSIADHSRAAQAIVDYLRNVGINANLNMMEFGAFGPHRLANEAGPLFIYSFGDWAGEPSFMIQWMMQNDASLFYQNQEILDLLDEASATFDIEARSEIYSQVQQLLREDAGFIYLFQADSVFAMQRTIDFQPRADELFDLYPLAIVADA